MGIRPFAELRSGEARSAPWQALNQGRSAPSNRSIFGEKAGEGFGIARGPPMADGAIALPQSGSALDRLEEVGAGKRDGVLHREAAGDAGRNAGRERAAGAVGGFGVDTRAVEEVLALLGRQNVDDDVAWN